MKTNLVSVISVCIRSDYTPISLAREERSACLLGLAHRCFENRFSLTTDPVQTTEHALHIYWTWSKVDAAYHCNHSICEGVHNPSHEIKQKPI